MDKALELSEVLDTFIYLCKGKSWVLRNDCHTFEVGVKYHAVVEKIQSEKEATLVIGKKNDGFPLMCYEDWNEGNIEFGRVLLTVNRLHPEESLLPYGKTTCLNNVLNEGDNLEVKIEKNAGESPNLFFYSATAGWKVKPTDCMKNNIVNVRDPLRGYVEKVVEKEQLGVINFGTYCGYVAKAVFFSSHLYVNGEKCNNCVLTNSLTPIGTELYLEVANWTTNGIIQEWEADLRRVGIKFIATRVWLKGEPLPTRAGREDHPLNTAEINSSGKENAFTQYSLLNPGDSKERSMSNSPSKLHQESKGKCDSCRDVNGTLISLEESWGLVGVQDEVLVFQSSNVYLFGLQLQDVPLHKIFYFDQAVEVCIQSTEVVRLDYGKPLKYDEMRKSILIYCEKNLIADSVKEKLVQSMNRQNT